MVLQRLGGRLLLVGVARNEPPKPAIRHVNEAGAVDPAIGHAAPLVRRAEIAPRLRDRVPGAREARPLAVGLVAERILADPARVAVRGADPRPAACALLDRERLAGEGLCHLLGAVVRLCAHGRDLRGTDAELHYAGRMRGSRRA